MMARKDLKSEVYEFLVQVDMAEEFEKVKDFSLEYLTEYLEEMKRIFEESGGEND